MRVSIPPSRMRGGGSVDWPAMADGGYLGRRRKARRRPRGRARRGGLRARAARRAAPRLRPLAVRHRARRGARRGRRAAARDGAGAARRACSSCMRSRSPSSRGRPSSATPSTRARPSSCGASGAERRRLAERRPAAPRGVPRRPARVRAPRRGRARRRARRLRARRSRVHARELRDSLAADYTYLQAAQPTTAGHLLLAYAYPALRDGERLRHAHRELSRSVAGVGGSAGSRWPLDRDLLASPAGRRRPRAARQGRRLAVGRLRRAALDARDLRDAPLAAGAGLRDLREQRVRPRSSWPTSTRARAR